ncbi:MAG TPA: cytochrome c [Terriglobia bacterium]|nr:cytochrome c [Terriglobia bacterium]
MINPKIVKSFVLGAIAAYGGAAFVLLSSAKLGVLPVQADVAPSRLEAKLLGSALHAAVARNAPGGPNPMPASDENLIAGAKVYREMCARCHGGSRESDNTYGRSFYPPAPQLPLTRSSYSDNEMFWIVKHGIRNTAMPAWSNLLSDQEIWQVVTLLRKFDSLPDP